ncbi:MAG: sensor histidine kinase [Nitrosopumilaceae archaeon]
MNTKLTNHAVAFTISVIAVTIGVVSITVLYYSDLMASKEAQEVIQTMTYQAGLSANIFSNYISDAVRLVEFTSKRAQVKDVQHADLISPDLKGIPEDVDIGKRDVAREVLSKHHGFEAVAFFLSNGDSYLFEPYSYQQNLQYPNWSFRDWYKEVMKTQSTYVSDVYKSTSSKHSVVAIRTPVYSDDGTQVGIWGGNLDLTYAKEQLTQNLVDAQRMIIVDEIGNEVIDTAEVIEDLEVESFVSMAVVTEALAGNSGSYIDTVDGTKTFIIYQPTKIQDRTWALLLMEPYDSAFSGVTIIHNLSYVMIGVIALVLSVSGYFIFRTIRSNTKLNKELQTANERLKEVDKIKDEFSSMIAHELKSPLAPIQGYSELLMKGKLGELNERQKNSAKTIFDNAVRLLRLIQDILDARKLELGKLKHYLRDTSTKEITDSCINAFKTQAESKGIILTNGTQDIPLKCDAERIIQVLNNLVSNALKFVLPNQGKIEINTKLDNGSVVFSIKDNGIGIPKDKQDELFKKFYQVDTSLGRRSGGSGLGLAICKGIVELHGGRIWVESEEGKGTAIYFSVPKDGKDEEHTSSR